MHIELNTFLKVKGICSTGGEAKILIREGHVKVNNEVETRNKKKLIEKDKVEVLNQTFIIEKEILR